ncbi:hypothetical protein F5972_08560 [Microbispora cellulosiformans]|uniref:Homeodomain-like domain-containing protein n=1 Tax=Microbispora cellulosiformans TaxID=2614688 RepID=A0A5J5K8E9_9ACTN|nr:hypothetical protein [Microbispora cellulosiformans]KAA9379693.1 hypothetical protein F5972_08560 [Microbispora cellulosiformans]
MTALVPAPRAGDDGLQAVRRERALAGVAAARRRITEAEKAEVRAVAVARQAGATWDEVAQRLGIKQPNAVRKYRAPVLELLRRGLCPAADRAGL